MSELRERKPAASAGTSEKPAKTAVAKPEVEQTGVFDFAAHFRSLYTQPARGGGFATLDGFRKRPLHADRHSLLRRAGAMLSLWIISFHTVAYVCNFFHDHDIRVVSREHLILIPMMSGPVAVDVSGRQHQLVPTHSLRSGRASSC